MRNKRNRYKTEPKRRKLVRGFVKAVLAGCFVVVVVPLLSAAFAHAYYALLEAPWPQLEEIEIVGANRIERRDILNVLGVARGANLFTVRVSQLAERLESLPWLRSAVVRLDLPGRLVVEISEREPLAVVHVDDFYLMDTQGKLFLKVRPTQYPDLMLVTGFCAADLRNGEYLQKRPLEVLRGLLAALRKVQDWFPPQSISDCHWGSTRGFTVHTSQGGVPIHLGEEDFDAKLARLNRVFGVLMDRQCLHMVTSIDVDYSNRAYIEGHFPAPKGI